MNKKCRGKKYLKFAPYFFEENVTCHRVFLSIWVKGLIAGERRFMWRIIKL